MLHCAEGSCDAFRRVEFNEMALAVVESQGVAGKAFTPGNRQAGGGIQPTAEETDCFHLGNLNERKQESTGTKINALKAVCKV